MPKSYNINELVETNFVHLDGNEIVDGIKTFLQSILLPTPAAGDNSTKAATTAFIQAALAVYAKLASPTFTGTPKAPTAASNTNTTQIATTAFVKSVLSSSGNGFATYSKSGNGYIKFANGIILQWGRLSSQSSQDYSVTLPTPFSSSSSYVPLIIDTTTSNGQSHCSVTSAITTKFSGKHSSDGTTMFWIAIGY